VTSTATTVPPARDTLQVEIAQESLLLGLRQVIARGVVDVSLYFAVGGAHAKSRGDVPTANESASLVPGGRSNVLAVVGGIAVERELIDSLALRLSADVVGASLSKSERVSIDSTTREPKTTEYNNTNVGLSVRPALQIQFYF
jgi:hypothetical protein